MAIISIPNIIPQSFLISLRNSSSEDDISAVLVSLQSFEEIVHSGIGWQPFLSYYEWEKTSQYPLLKRKVEWMAGRYCAKLAIAGLASPECRYPLPDIVIANNQDGRPYIRTGPPSLNSMELDISISHGNGFACSLASRRYCGIDIQAPRDTLLRVWDRFCSLSEEKLLAQAIHQERLSLLTLLWAAKEAVRKCCSHTHLPGFQDIQLKKVVNSGPILQLLFSVNEMEIIVTCTFYQGHGLAACFFPEYSYA